MQSSWSPGLRSWAWRGWFSIRLFVFYEWKLVRTLEWKPQCETPIAFSRWSLAVAVLRSNNTFASRFQAWMHARIKSFAMHSKAVWIGRISSPTISILFWNRRIRPLWTSQRFQRSIASHILHSVLSNYYNYNCCCCWLCKRENWGLHWTIENTMEGIVTGKTLILEVNDVQSLIMNRTAETFSRL